MTAKDGADVLLQKIVATECHAWWACVHVCYIHTVDGVAATNHLSGPFHFISFTLQVLLETRKRWIGTRTKQHLIGWGGVWTRGEEAT